MRINTFPSISWLWSCIYEKSNDELVSEISSSENWVPRTNNVEYLIMILQALKHNGRNLTLYEK